MNKKITLLLLIASVLLINACAPTPIIEYRSLQIDHVKEDSHLKNPSEYATSPFRGTHNFIKGTEVIITNNDASGYGVSKWVVQELNQNVPPYQVETSSFKVVLDSDYQVSAKLHCEHDNVCIEGYVCVNKECIKESGELTGTYVQGDTEQLGKRLAVIERIGTSAVLLTIENQTLPVALGSTQTFSEANNIRARLDNITYDLFENESCVTNLTGSSAIIKINNNNYVETTLMEEEFLEIGEFTITLEKVNVDSATISINDFHYTIDFNQDLNVHPWINIKLIRLNVMNSTATIRIEYFLDEQVVFLVHPDEAEVNGKIITLEGMTTTQALIRINQEEKWIELGEQEYYQNIDKYVLLDSIFFEDDCGPMPINQEATITFNY